MTAKKNKTVAIVTGGSKGIGRAICGELARAGYYVAINYMGNKKGAEQTLAMVEESGSQGEICQFDVRDGQAAERAVEDLASRFDGIDVLVNNAGIIADGLFMMMSRDNWQSVIDTSLNGFYNMTRPVWKNGTQAQGVHCFHLVRSVTHGQPGAG